MPNKQTPVIQISTSQTSKALQIPADAAISQKNAVANENSQLIKEYINEEGDKTCPIVDAFCG